VARESYASCSSTHNATKTIETKEIKQFKEIQLFVDLWLAVHHEAMELAQNLLSQGEYMRN